MGGSWGPRGDPRQELRWALVWWAWTQEDLLPGPATCCLCWTSEGARTGQGLQGKKPMKMQPLSSHQGPGKQLPSCRQAGRQEGRQGQEESPAFPTPVSLHALEPEAEDALG